MRALLDDIGSLSALITVRTDGQDTRRPSFQISAAGADMGVRFAAIRWATNSAPWCWRCSRPAVTRPRSSRGHRPDQEPQRRVRVRDLYEPELPQLPRRRAGPQPDAVLNPRVHHVAIDGGLFQDEVEARQIMAVPTVYLNGQPFGSGRMELSEILSKIDTGAAARDAARLATKDAFDVLIVGGGPAGAAAAIYAARKGIRTGIVAERVGGQTLDTLGIENFISVMETEGPKFAAALEAHVRSYDVDVMNGQRAQALEPAATPGGYATVTLDNGAELKGRSVIVATGARWRNVNVPGEQEYRNKGVAYCPHCDGPLFKGKKVAVIGAATPVSRRRSTSPGSCST